MNVLPISSLPAKLAAWAAYFVFAVTTLAQTLATDEVRISSHPYVLLPMIHAESQSVQLEVVVRDKYGRAVAGLTKDDFLVHDSGRIRDVSAFSVDTFNAPTVDQPKAANPVKDTEEAQVSPQIVTQAGKEAPKGRWIALVFDDISTATGDLAHAKIAAKRFVGEAVASGDHIGVFTTSAGGALEFSVDPAAIQNAVTNVQSHPRISPGGLALCPRMTAYEAYRIVNNDPSAMKAKVQEACSCSGAPECDIGDMDLLSGASLAIRDASGGTTISSVLVTVKAQAEQTWNQARLASQATLDGIKESLDQLAKKPGRRMLLLASSGFLSGMLDAEQDAIVTGAVRAGVVINSLDAKGLYAEAPGPPINESVEVVELPAGATVFQIQSLGDRLDSLDSAMARFAEGTGGLLFQNNNDLELGFRQLGILPACTYLLAFAPPQDGKYHRIKVELKNGRHGSIQVRSGYFAPAKVSGGQPNRTETIDSE